MRKTLLALFAVALLAACRTAPEQFGEEDYPRFIGQEFPDFELKDLNGRTVRWSEIKGRPALVNFWFTTCPPCVAEMPHLNALKKDFAGEDIVFLAISPDDSLKIRQFLEKRDFDFDLIPNAQAYINFFGNEYPLNVFVDRQGIIRHARGAIPMSFDQRNPQGFMDDREFRRMLGRLAR
jgi:cytochrome c biogenesis protein CcmG, thiol:disulfide interchange protein DsbE